MKEFEEATKIGEKNIKENLNTSLNVLGAFWLPIEKSFDQKGINAIVVHKIQNALIERYGHPLLISTILGMFTGEKN